MRILIVENDKRLGNGLRRALDCQGYAVHNVQSGEQALSAASSTFYDLILLNITLPGIDGFEVLQRLRRGNYDGCVLLLSANDTEAHCVKGLDLGADDYVTKPFSLPELEARVRALIRRRDVSKRSTLRFGDLSLDIGARVALVGSKEVKLTRRGWQMLEYLLARVGRHVEKGQMASELGHGGKSLSANAIEAYISRIRPILHKARIQVDAVHGIGYLIQDLNMSRPRRAKSARPEGVTQTSAI